MRFFYDAIGRAHERFKNGVRGMPWARWFDQAGVPAERLTRVTLHKRISKVLDTAAQAYLHTIRERTAQVNAAAGDAYDQRLADANRARFDQHLADQTGRIQWESEQAVRARIHRNMGTYFQHRFGLGAQFDFDRFYADLGGLAGRQNVRIGEKVWDPQAPLDALVRQYERIMDHPATLGTSLSHGLKVAGWNPFKLKSRAEAQKNIDRVLFRHYFGSHIGYDAADNLLADPDIDFSHIVRQVESRGPANVFAGMDRNQVYKAFQRAHEKAANARLGGTMVRLGGTAALAAILAAAGLTLGNRKIQDYYAGKAQKPPAALIVRQVGDETRQKQAQKTQARRPEPAQAAKKTGPAASPAFQSRTPLPTSVTIRPRPSARATPSAPVAPKRAEKPVSMRDAAEAAIAKRLGISVEKLKTEYHHNAGYDFVTVGETLLQRKAQVDPEFKKALAGKGASENGIRWHNQVVAGYADDIANAIVTNTEHLSKTGKMEWVQGGARTAKAPKPGKDVEARTAHNLGKLAQSFSFGWLERNAFQRGYKKLKSQR